jgi:hypothetical protein
MSTFNAIGKWRIPRDGFQTSDGQTQPGALDDGIVLHTERRPERCLIGRVFEDLKQIGHGRVFCTLLLGVKCA